MTVAFILVIAVAVIVNVLVILHTATFGFLHAYRVRKQQRAKRAWLLQTGKVAPVKVIAETENNAEFSCDDSSRKGLVHEGEGDSHSVRVDQLEAVSEQSDNGSEEDLPPTARQKIKYDANEIDAEVDAAPAEASPSRNISLAKPPSSPDQ